MSTLFIALTWLATHGVRVAFTVAAYAALLWFLVALWRSEPRVACNIRLTTLDDEEEEEEEETAAGDEDYENKIRRLTAVIEIGDDCRHRSSPTGLAEWDAARGFIDDLVPLPTKQSNIDGAAQ